MVDGGRPQLAAALEAVRASASPDLPVVSLAKRMEEVYVPGTPDPVVIPRTSEALYLLQRVRDEAHRFAITYHRKLRDRSMTRSVLDGIPGVGRPAAASWCATSARPARPPRPAWRSWSRCPASAPALGVYDHLHGADDGVHGGRRGGQGTDDARAADRGRCRRSSSS